MTMNRRSIIRSTAALAALVAAEGCSNGSGTTSSSSSTTARPSGLPSGGPGGGVGGLQPITAVNLNTNGMSPGGANTVDVVDAANAFLDTLTSSQNAKVVYDFSDDKARQTWSNYPATTVPRSGISMADLSSAQRDAVDALFSVALSQDGARQDRNIRMADDYLKSLGGQGADGFGSLADYFVAVYGTPSPADPFMIQFGGHHLARNLTYYGDNVSQTPQFVGSEPTSFISGGQTVQPVKPESSTMFGMLAGLSTDQLQAAQIPTSATIDDLQMGPGKDTGEFPTAAGLTVSELDADQRQLVIAATQAYAGDLGGTAGKLLVAKYQDEIDKTRIGWASSTSTQGEHSYIRIDGPSVWIEFINTRSQSTPNVHFHTVYRDKTNDYGSSKPV